MLLDRDTTGGDGLNNSSPSTMIPIVIQYRSHTISHTGHSERRAEIRTLWVNALVGAHNILVKEIVVSGTISTAEKNTILAMEQEWINAWWEFFGQIQENNTVYKMLISVYAP